ncbi:MAG: hypothetical protein R3F54_05830 [Alphaproteobacteria bacterium]
MATSSMHKPGWRSRRRSRLSLVERAVPRLGYHSGSDGPAKTVRSEPSPGTVPTPSRMTSETAVEPSDTDIRSERSSGSAPNGRTHADETAPTLDASTAGAGPEESDGWNAISHAAEMPEDAELPATAGDATITEMAEPEPPEAVAGGASVDVPDVEAVLAQMAAATNRAAAALEDEPEPEMPGAPLNPKLDIDWDDLVEKGFVDPRERSQPLPAAMDPIIRALLRQALSDQSSWRDRIILVTSANERVSKSTAAINFAFGLSTVGDHRAVLLDVDSAGVGAVGYLGGEDRRGITDALADESLTMDDLVIETDLDRLTLVASGTPDDDLLDNLASRRMLQILRHLTERPETILVIDAPPILISQEAAVLSVVAGQVVFAVEAGRTRDDQIEHALQRIGERHNVSLVLVESSGINHEDDPGAAGGMPLAVNRRAPQAKRSMPKAAAAAAGALALGLLILQPNVLAAPAPARAAGALAAPPGSVARPEPKPDPHQPAVRLCQGVCS